jgi:hypothetical protein
MEQSWDGHCKLVKQARLRKQIAHVFSHMKNLDPKNDMNVKGELF